MAEAADLGPRRAITGEPLAPLLTATAFFRRLPCSVDIETREAAEAHLAKLATQFRLDQAPNWPTGSPTASTPTATSPMRIGPAGAR